MSDTEREAGDAVLTLAERLRARIGEDGAITFRDWMEAALYDASGGYYQRADLTRWGRAGDYRTSPERSPLFAATCARYFAALYEELGAPAEFSIFEAGAGAGHFAHVLLNTLARDAPHVFGALRYVIDEVSAASRKRIAELLATSGLTVEFRRLSEMETIDTGIIFTNELFDAFPVHRVTMRGGTLYELYVDIDAAGDFMWLEREPSTPRLVEHFTCEHVTLDEGQVAEVNLDVEDWIAAAASALRRGFVVTVDYGDETASLYGASHRREGTLRSFNRHTFSADVLHHPGARDLTTTINWTQLQRAGEQAGLRTALFERQDRFMLRAGLLEQLERETELAGSEAARVSLRLGAREMILPGGMGESFQILVQKKREPETI